MLLVDGQCGPDLLDAAQQTEESQHAVDERAEGVERRTDIHHHGSAAVRAVDHRIHASGGRDVRYERPVETVRRDAELRLRIGVPCVDVVSPRLRLVGGGLIDGGGDLAARLRSPAACRAGGLRS